MEKVGMAIPEIISKITGVAATQEKNLKKIFEIPINDNEFMKNIQRISDAEPGDIYDRFQKSKGINDFDKDYFLNGFDLNTIEAAQTISRFNTYAETGGPLISALCEYEFGKKEYNFLNISITPCGTDQREINIRVGVDFDILIKYLEEEYDPEFDDYNLQEIKEATLADDEVLSAAENKAMIYFDYLVGLNCYLSIVDLTS